METITTPQIEALTDLLANVLDPDQIARQLEPTADAEDHEHECRRTTTKAARRMGVVEPAASALSVADLLALVPTIPKQRATEAIAWALEQR